MSGSVTQYEKLCLAVMTNSVAGTERIVRDIALSAISEGYEVSALVPAGDLLDTYADDLQRAGIMVGRVDRVHGVRNPLSNVLSSFRWFRANKPDIAHFHCASYVWGHDVLLGAILAGVPKIVRTEHNPVITPPSNLHKMQMALTDRHVDRFTYVSKGNKHKFEKVFALRKGRGVVFNNGADEKIHFPKHDPEERRKLRSELGLPEDSSIAIYVGTFGGRRPLNQLLLAFKQLLDNKERAETAAKWRLLIVGTGCRDQMDIPDQLGISDLVQFTGSRNDVPRLLRNSDLYVCSSHYEGLSCAMLEAWASGVPVVSTDVDGIEDVLGSDDYASQVVAHGDVPAYADAMYEIMTGNEKRIRLNTAGTEAVRTRFTTANMVKGYLDLYLALRSQIGENHAASNSLLRRSVGRRLLR